MWICFALIYNNSFCVHSLMWRLIWLHHNRAKIKSVKSSVHCFGMMSLSFQTERCRRTRGPFEVVGLSPINKDRSASSPLFCPMKSPPDNNIPNEYLHVKLLYICVMKSLIKLWEVNAFHCESEPLSPHLLYPHRPVYQKYVCCYCVHTISLTMTYNYTERPKLPLWYWY